jgi:hypothetical protein
MKFLLLLCLLLSGLSAHALQDAIVMADKAYIYSDKEASSIIGFVRKGKKIKVGDVAMNKGQLFPLFVSGKIAYIRAVDVSTEKLALESDILLAERFRRNTHGNFKTKYVASYFTFLSKASLSAENGDLGDKDSVLWHGLSLKGESNLKPNWDMQVIINYMGASTDDNERFKLFETGLGAAYRIINQHRFLLRLEAQFLPIPYASYELGDEFRVTGFGYTLGAGANATLMFATHWGVEGSAGVYSTQLLKFKPPEPYSDFSASFVGSRVSVGLNYQY